MRKPFSQKKIANFVLIIPLRRAKIKNMHWFKNVQKLNKKKQVFLTESKERH